MTGCARRNKPGVYTNVANYDTFIRKSICALADDKPDYCDNLDYGDIRVRTGETCGEPEPEPDRGGCDDFLGCLLFFLDLIFCGLLS
jgi:hypothetical protein